MKLSRLLVLGSPITGSKLMLGLMLIIASLTLPSCTRDAELNSTTSSAPVETREPSEDLPTLCIGCGCGQAYQNCLIGGSSHSCWDLFEEIIDEKCCKEQRAQCHHCANGIICVRWSFIEPTYPASQFYSISYPFSPSDSLLLLPYWDQIEKFLDGVELSDEDFEVLDEDRI